VPYTTRPVVALTVAAVTVAVIGTAALLFRNTHVFLKGIPR
jgi:hypothetical protein